MAEDQTDTSTDTEDNDDDQTTDRADTTSTDKDDAVKWKAMARKHERESKALATKVKEFEDASKSDAQKLTERAEGAEGRASTAEAKALRLEVALDKGLPKSLATRLQGSTREEMEADADELLSTIGDGNGRRRPPDFEGGTRDRSDSNPGSFLAQALRKS